MIEAFKSVRKERAGIEHDRLYIESMLEDEAVDASLSAMAPMTMMEGVDISDADIEALIDKLPVTDGDDEEIEKILKSKKNLSIDDVMGIAGDEDEDDDLDIDDEDDE
jgi:hypothetical protein